MAEPRLFVLRHGRSVANEKGLIASALANAGDAYGLTTKGRDQLRGSLEALREKGAEPAGRRLVIVSSPLLRARETAEIAADLLGASTRIDHRLMERGFGDLELGSDDQYESVWEIDRQDPSHSTWGVESVVEVWARVHHLLEELAAAAPEAVILVTHGDVASTLICASMGEALSRHREVGGLATGELRALHWPRAPEPPIFLAES